MSKPTTYPIMTLIFIKWLHMARMNINSRASLKVTATTSNETTKWSNIIKWLAKPRSSRILV